MNQVAPKNRGPDVLDRICRNCRSAERLGCDCRLYRFEAVMKTLRLTVFFVIGLLFGAWSVLSHADTVPATTGVTGYTVWDYRFNISASMDVNALCTAAIAYKNTLGASQYQVDSCVLTNASRTGVSVGTQVGLLKYNYKGVSGPGGYAGQLTINVATVGYYCPDSSYTLSGSSCSKPDNCPMYNPTAPDSQSQAAPAGCSCPSGTSWYPYNGCRKTCGTASNGTLGGGADYYIDKSAASQCAGGCEAFPTGDWMDATDGKHRWTQLASSGWACKGTTQDATQPDNNDPKLDPTKKKPPVCGATDGVMTTNTGKVLCVPEGTPDARKPDVKVKQKVESFPDNSSRTTTETQTTDPATHATDTRSSTTTSTKPDGTEGQAGKAGTSTSTSNVSGTGPGGNGNGDGDGGCDPTLNFCGGPGTDGLYTKKEKTLDSVLASFQNTVKGSPVGSASTSFFNVSTPSGGCPAWSVTVPMLNITLDGSSIFCNGTILSAMNAAGAVLLALATYIAFTWAFL